MCLAWIWSRDVTCRIDHMCKTSHLTNLNPITIHGSLKKLIDLCHSINTRIYSRIRNNLWRLNNTKYYSAVSSVVVGDCAVSVEVDNVDWCSSVDHLGVVIAGEIMINRWYQLECLSEILCAIGLWKLRSSDKFSRTIYTHTHTHTHIYIYINDTETVKHACELNDHQIVMTI